MPFFIMPKTFVPDGQIINLPPDAQGGQTHQNRWEFLSRRHETKYVLKRVKKNGKTGWDVKEEALPDCCAG